MTIIAAPTEKDQELVSFGLVESASVKSITDFLPSNLNESQVRTEKEEDDFKNTVICNLIFYAIFCVSIVLHILIDLGLGAFIKNKFVQLIRIGKKTFFEKNLAFA
tara:strand:+ start:596 stop:913 length:318 start_codon:yes stop_codon:yes gene_type:complete